MPPTDAALEVRLRDATRFSRLVHVPVCDSTQDLAQATRDDAVVWADEQQAGRGRLGRAWHGAPGEDVEITLRIEEPGLDDPSLLAPIVPTAVAAALEPFARRPIRIDWPNDLLCGGRKLAGVLIDALGNPPRTFLIGIGVNVNRSTFPPELRDSATSIALATGERVDRDAVVFAIAEAVDRAVAAAVHGDTAALAREFRERLGLVGKAVTIVESGATITGRLLDVDLIKAEVEGGKVVRLALVRSLEPR